MPGTGKSGIRNGTMRKMNASLVAAEGKLRDHRRDLAERLWARAGLLSDDDRTLLSMYLDHGSSYRQIARLIGVRPTTVARRIRKITERLLDETYPICLRHRGCFSEPQLAVIRDFFARGLTMTDISQMHGLSYYRVRSTVLAAQQFVGSVRRRGTRDTNILPTGSHQ